MKKDHVLLLKKMVSLLLHWQQEVITTQLKNPIMAIR
jgi:hypothetical protein